MSAEGLAAGEELGVEADPESVVGAELERRGMFACGEETRFVGSGLAFPPLCDVCLQKRAVIIL